MSIPVVSSALSGCALLLMAAGAFAYTPEEGDIVFQESRSAQSKAVQAATKSRYSHMGIVLYQKGKPMVFEAVQPVKFTPLKAWLDRGNRRHYVIKRLKQPLAPATVRKLHQAAARYEGKAYDLTFEWSDDRMYCSELVWKMYKEAADIELAPLSRLGSFDLSASVVKVKLKERYGANVPLDEPVIAPVGIFDSRSLKTVDER